MMEQLTPREIEVARMIAAGKGYARIARELGIKHDTVNKHVQSAAEKIGGTGSPKMRLVVFVVEFLRAEPARRESA